MSQFSWKDAWIQSNERIKKSQEDNALFIILFYYLVNPAIMCLLTIPAVNKIAALVGLNFNVPVIVAVLLSYVLRLEIGIFIFVLSLFVGKVV